MKITKNITKITKMNGKKSDKNKKIIKNPKIDKVS